MNSIERDHKGLKPAIPPDEARRLATLYSLDLLDTSSHEAFDRITRMARRIFATPIALISFVDADRDWFKSSQGLTIAELPREISFTSHAILSREVTVVEDASSDLRFFDNQLVKGEPGIRFYAGHPVAAWNGINLGALSIMDVRPRTLTDDERVVLHELAAAVEHEIGSSALNLVDELTGLVNRRGLRLIASHIIDRAGREGESLSLLFVDFCDMNSLNKRLGRRAGDAALVEVADVFRETLRGADIPGRMRGDDFAILLPDTEEDEAMAVIERIRQELHVREKRDRLPFGLNVRIACATVDPSTEEFSLDGLISRAEFAT